MTVATGNFAELLWPGIRSIWGETYDDFDTVYTQCFNVVNSTLTFEKEQGVTGLGLAAVKQQGATVSYQDPVQGFQKEYSHVVYGLGSSVTREMWTDDQYRYINRIPQMLARSMRHTEETVHANVFNNSFSSEQTADGVSIINASHPNVATGTTQSNQPAVASDLSQTALEQMFIDVADWLDDQDLKIQIMPYKLLVPRQLRFTAQKILMTAGEVASADNTINPMYEALAPVEWVYLTDADAWWVLMDGVPNGFTSFTRWDTQLDRDNEFDTQSLKFLTTRRWSQGATDWKQVYGTAGA